MAPLLSSLQANMEQFIGHQIIVVVESEDGPRRSMWGLFSQFDLDEAAETVVLTLDGKPQRPITPLQFSRVKWGGDDHTVWLNPETYVRLFKGSDLHMTPVEGKQGLSTQERPDSGRLVKPVRV